MRWVQALLLGVLAAGGLAWVLIESPAAPAAEAAPVQVRQDPFLITFPRVRQAPSRMTYVLADGTRHTLRNVVSSRPVQGGREYVVATDEPGRRAHVRVVATAPGVVSVRWRLEPDTEVAEVHESFAAPGEQHFLGTGQRESAVDLLGKVMPLRVNAECAGTVVAPYFASSAGYAVRLESTATGQIGFKAARPVRQCLPPLWRPLCELAPAAGEVRICLRGSSLAYEVYTGGFAENLGLFTGRTGRPRLPPPAQFALIKWRDAVEHADELIDDVEQLQRRRIPVGWALLDNPWETECYGSLQWDTGRVPDPAATARTLRQRGVRLMLWVSPYVRCPPAGYAEDELIGRSGTRTIDLTADTARARYRERLRAVFAAGIDGVKGDRGDEHDLEGKQFEDGWGASLHNAYPSLFAQTVAAVLREARGADVVTMFRAGWSGAQRHVNFWAGDQDGTWDGLRRAIRAGQTAAVSGYSIWGSDVGGYRSEGLAADVFVRWAQLGAISPILEVGGRGPHARFWEFGEPTVAAFRRAAVLHYELFPHLYELARRSVRTGAPILRPLGWQYPSDRRSWAAELQLLVGPQLLAAPVTKPGTRADVYLPPGRWVDIWRGTSAAGPRKLVRPTPLAELPLYLRAGSAIRFDFRAPAIWAAPWGVNDLGRADRAGWLLAPGGPTTATAVGGGTLRAKPTDGRLEVSLTGAPREVQVLVARRERPRRVLVGGRALPAAPSAAALRGRAAGWIHVAGPVPGVVVKLGSGAPRRFTLVG